jgi:hypothetical protein
VRRRGWGRRSGASQGPFERLKGLRAGVSELEAVHADALPEGIEIGAGLFEERRVAVVASTRPGEDLLGWARVAALCADSDGALEEALVVAPLHAARTRELAAAAAAQGLRVTLLSIAALSEASDDLIDIETFPDGSARPLDAGASVYARVARVVEGAAAVTASGGLRATSAGAVLYMRGVLVARIRREAEGVAVSIVVPDPRRIFVNEESFPRWGVELHEMVVSLAQDPRLVEAISRQNAVDLAAANAGVTISSRWLPTGPDGEACVDFAGLDRHGQPVVCIVRDKISLADVAALATAQLVIVAAPERWTPGGRGIARAIAASTSVDALAQPVLAVLASEVPAPPLARPVARPPRPSRSPRRGGPDREEVHSAAELDGEGEESSETLEEGGRDRRGPRRRRRRRRPPRGGESRADVQGSDEPELEEDRDLEEERGPEAGRPEAAERPETEDDADIEAEASEPVEAPVALVEDAAEEAETSEPEEEELQALPRRRRARATIVARDDAEAVLAALVLARDRRTTTSFRVVRQEDLLDYLKGPANDVAESEDLLIVGFEAQPHSRELVQIAELFRGQLQWFDHHAWAIEDLEGMRNALGRESVLVEEAASPLGAVSQVTERRSRFTDKLVDLSGRRLSESDMQKWGNRVIGLIEKLVARPGEHRPAVGPVLSGKPAELPAAEGVFDQEAQWVEDNDPRMVHFGEYDLAVFEVPRDLDPAEVARRVRLTTGARLSLGTREGDDLVLLGCSDDKRPLNVTGMADLLGATKTWARSRSSADRTGRLWIEERIAHPERMEAVIHEIVRQRSVLYG